MALLATRRIAIPAARAARRSVAPLQVRAFRDEKAAQPPKDAAAGNMEVAKAEAAAPAPQVPQMAPQLRVRNLFDEMEREMSQLSRAFFGDTAFSPFLMPFSARRRGADPFESLLAPAEEAMARTMRLAADVSEDDKAFTIKADVPGMSKDDVKVSLDDGVLTIKGERHEEKKEEQEGKVKWVERSHGSFVRRFALPDRGVDAAGITAALKDGVMTVTIPKVAAEEPAAKEIPISTE